jgi:hypothetical protein
MQFCQSCDNTLYMHVSSNDAESNDAESAEKTTDTPFLYCKMCSQNTQNVSFENDTSSSEDMCMYRSSYSKNHTLFYSTLVNEYSLFDPTLPVLPSHIVMQHRCVGNTLRYICYDESKLRYIYLCNKCLNCFTLDQPNTPLFTWKLKSLKD